MTDPRTWAIVALASLALLVPTGAHAHEELRRAAPGEGEELMVAPTELRLTFVNAVRLPSAHLTLRGPNGAVELGELRRSTDAANVLVGLIEGPLVAGDYTVHWQVAGPDGHPVRGVYTFTVLPDAAGLAPPEPASAEPDTAPTDTARAEPFPLASDFDAGSPLYAAVRWLTFLGLLGTIGTVAFRFLVLSLLRRARDTAGERLIPDASARAGVIGMAAAVLLAVALGLRLYAQSYALHGPQRALDAEVIASLLSGTTWSLGWWLQAIGTGMALAGFLLTRRQPHGKRRAGWGLALAGAVVLAFTPAFSGHAAAVAGLAPVAVLSDGLHVLGAGGWLGSLLLVVVAGLPVALRQEERRAAAVASLINAFSPTALFFAGVVIATGIFSTWLHVGVVPALWTSSYGRTLLLKVGVLSLLFATGAYNWLKVKPALGTEAAAARLRRSATFELAVAVLVLAITAVLVATPPPSSLHP